MPLLCDRCRTVLPDACLNTPAPIACPGCQAPLLARVFPAFWQEPKVGQTAETVGSDEDASCFFHARKKAVVPCGRCGRFLCALCDIDLGGRHLCPVCAAEGTPAAAANPGDGGGELANGRVLYDRLALSLALLPLLMWPLTLFTAPAALFYALRHWNDPPRGLIPRRRFVVMAAALISLVEVAGWGVIGYYGFFSHRPLFFHVSTFSSDALNPF